MEEKSKDLEIFDRRHHMTAVEREATDLPSPNAVILMAMQKGYSPELIEKMMDLQERNEKNEARKAYNKAMAAFKANPPRIEKTKKADFGGNKAKYFYADLADASVKINEALSPHGCHATWKTEQTENLISVTCTISHELGHSESTTLSAAPDTSGSKNSIQAIGSTIFYLERYTLFALTGLAAHGMDDDGQSSQNIEYITEKQLSTIIDMINSKEVDQAKFCQWLKVDAPEYILSKDYNKAITALKAKK